MLASAITACRRCDGSLGLYSAHLISFPLEELEGWEPSDLHSFHLVLCGVHLGNHDIFIRRKVFSQLVPDGSQLLAVATPRGICSEQTSQVT